MRTSFSFATFIYLGLCLTGLFFTEALFAQQNQKANKYWTIGGNFGMIGFSPSHLNIISGNQYFQRTTNGLGFGQVEDVSGRKRLAFLTNTSIGINSGLLFESKDTRSFFGIEGEFQNNKACYAFDPPFSFVTHGDSFRKWVQSDKYFKYSLALQYAHYLDENSRFFDTRYIYFRSSFGQTFYHRNFDVPLKDGYTEDWTDNGTGVINTLKNVHKTSYMLTGEVGLKSFTDDNLNTLDFGIVYYAPFSNTYVEEDEFFKQGTSVGKSEITFNGSTIMFNLRYTANFKIKPKAIDPIKQKQKEELLAQKEEEEEQRKYEKAEEKRKREEEKQAKLDKKNGKKEDKKIAKQRKVNGRDMQVQFKMKVKSDSIVIAVWDRGRIDGDRISLYLNDKLVEEDLTLEKAPHMIVLHLEPGVNYLTMNALNLGTIPPNTAAMTITTSEGKMTFKVVSDNGKSGAIEIDYKKF